MGSKKQTVKPVLIINKFGPDDTDITGKSAYDLGCYLLEHGFQVKYLAVKNAGKNNSPHKVVLSTAHITKVSRIGLGSNAWGRLISSLLEGSFLMVRALFIPKSTVIVMTAPPMMNFFGILLHKLSRCRVVFWTMDLYPDAFVSSGLVKPSNRLYKFVDRFVYRRPAKAFIALGNQQLSYLHKKYNIPLTAFVIPCGIQHITRDAVQPAWITNEDKHKLKFCYAGNIGEAHDEKFLISFAKALQPDKHVLYINLYGTKALQVLAAIGQLPCIKKIKYLAYGQMHFIDVHLASLLPRWDHVCVPSKAVSAICAGAVLLLNTSTQCDAWAMFKDACWLLEQKRDNYETDIHIFLTEVNPAQIALKKQQALNLAASLQAAQHNTYQAFAGWMKQL